MLRNITTPISFVLNLCSKGKISTIIFNRYMSAIIYMAKELTIIIKMGEKKQQQPTNTYRISMFTKTLVVLKTFVNVDM